MYGINVKSTIIGIFAITIALLLTLALLNEPFIVNFGISLYSFAYFYLFTNLLHKKDKYDIKCMIEVCKDEYVFDENLNLLKDAIDKISREKFDLLAITFKIIILVPYVIPLFFPPDIFGFVVFIVYFVIFFFLTRHFIFPKVTEMGKIEKLDTILTEARFRNDDE